VAGPGTDFTRAFRASDGLIGAIETACGNRAIWSTQGR